MISLSIAELFRDLLRTEPFVVFDRHVWEWMLHSRDEWTLQFGRSGAPNISMRFIKTQLQPPDSRGARSHRTPYFDLDHVKEINMGFHDGFDLDDRSMIRVYSVFRPLIPMLRGRGIKITLQFSPHKWGPLTQDNETGIVLSDIVDDSTAWLITKLSQEISELRINVGGVQVQSQVLEKEI
ncbi:hypothetical protein NLI96_g9067 [Meripilus lineatus]|uniref:Uncharacterized protein n=1 Tax=Meripilus lineatus TaxID=2056292 RepID=A0AAD5YFN9_9APHY|nr:hypothetical protein NLI96_g9067 [Physisporinus lineatus]